MFVDRASSKPRGWDVPGPDGVAGVQMDVEAVDADEDEDEVGGNSGGAPGMPPAVRKVPCPHGSTCGKRPPMLPS